MITFILPGFSASNKEWVDEVLRNIKLGGDIRPIYWDHWTDTQKKFNPEEKARMLSNVTGSDTVNIISKSLGTLVASFMIKSIAGRINKVVLNGVPMTDLNENDKLVITEALRSLPPKKIICIQNSNDNHGSFSEAKEFVGGINQEIKIIEKEASDHNYPYYQDFQSFLEG